MNSSIVIAGLVTIAVAILFVFTMRSELTRLERERANVSEPVATTLQQARLQENILIKVQTPQQVAVDIVTGNASVFYLALTVKPLSMPKKVAPDINVKTSPSVLGYDALTERFDFTSDITGPLTRKT